jgi:hypothetical protein
MTHHKDEQGISLDKLKTLGFHGIGFIFSFSQLLSFYHHYVSTIFFVYHTSTITEMDYHSRNYFKSRARARNRSNRISSQLDRQPWEFHFISSSLDFPPQARRLSCLLFSSWNCEMWWSTLNLFIIMARRPCHAPRSSVLSFLLMTSCLPYILTVYVKKHSKRNKEEVSTNFINLQFWLLTTVTTHNTQKYTHFWFHPC